ncbi:MAG TPA: thioredoxin family protein [Bacillota bacterium]|jgi:small redox-active disulfide protein 2
MLVEVKILGGGCQRCNELERLTKEALRDLGLGAEVGHVHEPAEIMKYGVMQTPALVVDGKVLVAGRVPNRAELAKLLRP